MNSIHFFCMKGDNVTKLCHFCFKVHFLFHSFAIRGIFAGSSVNPSFIPQLP